SGSGHRPCRPCVIAFLSQPAATQDSTLSLHDALPIWRRRQLPDYSTTRTARRCSRYLFSQFIARRTRSTTTNSPTTLPLIGTSADRKSTRLNSSHVKNSYAVFCLKKKSLGQLL